MHPFYSIDMTRHDSFQLRHIGPRREEIQSMLEAIGVSSIDQLIDETLPKSIRLKGPLQIEEGISEYEFLEHAKQLGNLNTLNRNFIGQGYYGTITPSVIKRNILENPGWYTAYTPYQAEISQGRLEGLLNFQTVISDLTGLEIANASLLDEGTAAAEAVMMLYHSRTREQQKSNIHKFFIDDMCFGQTIEVVKAKAKAIGVDIVIGSVEDLQLDDSYFGILLQSPNKEGVISDYSPVMSQVEELNIKTVVASDLLALCLMKPPGEWGCRCGGRKHATFRGPHGIWRSSRRFLRYEGRVQAKHPWKNHWSFHRPR